VDRLEAVQEYGRAFDWRMRDMVVALVGQVDVDRGQGG
jgi:hypothetical protein